MKLLYYNNGLTRSLQQLQGNRFFAVLFRKKVHFRNWWSYCLVITESTSILFGPRKIEMLNNNNM